MKKIICILFLFVNLIVFGQDNPLEDIVRKATHTEDGNINLDIQKLPNDSSKSVAALVKRIDDSEDGVEDLDLTLLLIDNASQKILSQYTEEEKYTSDAVMLEGIKLDMSNYLITDGIRAFGIRDHYRTQSQPNPYGSENLSLYMIKGDKFYPILDKFQTYLYSGETDMKCYFDGEETNSLLIMQQSKTNGYYDIKVKSTKKILRSRNPKKADGDCIDSEKKLKPTYRTLKFVKGSYQLISKRKRK